MLPVLGFVLFLLQHSPLRAQPKIVTLQLSECQLKSGPFDPEQIIVFKDFYSCMQGKRAIAYTNFEPYYTTVCMKNNSLDRGKANQMEALDIAKNCTEAYTKAAYKAFKAVKKYFVFGPTVIQQVAPDVQTYYLFLWTVLERVTYKLKVPNATQDRTLPPTLALPVFREVCSCSQYVGQCKLCDALWTVHASHCPNANLTLTQLLQTLQDYTHALHTIKSTASTPTVTMTKEWDEQLCDDLWKSISISCAIPAAFPCNSRGCHLDISSSDKHILEDLAGWRMDYFSLLKMHSIIKGCQAGPPPRTTWPRTTSPRTTWPRRTTLTPYTIPQWYTSVKSNTPVISTERITATSDPSKGNNETVTPTKSLYQISILSLVLVNVCVYTFLFFITLHAGMMAFINENLYLVIGLGSGAILLLIIICAVCLYCWCRNSDKPVHDAAMYPYEHSGPVQAPPIHQPAAPAPYTGIQASERSRGSSRSMSSSSASQNPFPQQQNYPPYPQSPSGSYLQPQDYYDSYAPYPPGDQGFGYPALPEPQDGSSGDSASEEGSADRSRRRQY